MPVDMFDRCPLQTLPSLIITLKPRRLTSACLSPEPNEEVALSLSQARRQLHVLDWNLLRRLLSDVSPAQGVKVYASHSTRAL